MMKLLIGLLAMITSCSIFPQIPLVFSTDRFHAEKVTQNHESYLAEILTNEEVQQAYNTTDELTFTNIPVQMKIITDQWKQYGYGLYILFDQQRNFIGFAGFHTIDIDKTDTVQCFKLDDVAHDIEFYLFLMPYAWRKGYGYEIGVKLLELAFTYLPYASIVAYVEQKNIASQRLIEKLKFNKERVVSYNDKPHMFYRIVRRKCDSMKVYVSAKFDDKERVEILYNLLKSQGHTITHEWIHNKQSYPFDVEPRYTAECATKDFNGVLASDILILLSNGQQSMGASGELGAAIASFLIFKRPKIYVVGPHFNTNFCFYHPAVIQKNSVEEVMQDIDKKELY